MDDFPTRRFSWDELVQIITVDHDLARLRRCRHDQNVYDDYMTNQVRARYHSVMDFILITKLDVPSQKEGDSSLPSVTKMRAVPVAQVTDAGQVRKRLLRNDFPYYFATDVDHWILWKLGGGEITLQEIEDAKEELRNTLRNVVDTLHWINPPALKSIPEIDHVHILCRRAAEENDV